MTPLVIAGSASGVGKTTIAVGLMGALRQRGLSVAPFKTGPDYIDPGYHQAVTGNPSRNLDTWLTSPDIVSEIFRRGSAGADVAVIEGAMGLFDGRTGCGNVCSTAETARLTGGSVALVVDCSRLARSLAPLLAGFAAFDHKVNLAGAILNNVGSAGHARALEGAAREAGVPVLGVLPRREDIHLRSRHLGLVQAEESVRRRGSVQAKETVHAGESVHSGELDELLGRIISHVAENVDLDRLRALAAIEKSEKESSRHAGKAKGRGRVRIAVARDEAFSFYYVDSLEALEAAGAELVYFSPVHDTELPDCEGMYLGGGYPELFASELEANSPMRRSIAHAVDRELPVYAECGGLVYLCRAVTVDGVARGMAGALPLEAKMTGRRQALGYVEASARKDNLLLEAGETVRGHEFHWSAVEWRQRNVAYDCHSSREAASKPDGFSAGNLLASYVHIHFAGNPEAAARFVRTCAVEGVASRAV